MYDKLGIFSCDSGAGLGSRIIQHLRTISEAHRGQDRYAKIYTPEAIETYYPNGEVKTVIKDSLRGDDIYIVQNIDDPMSERSVNDNFFSLLSAIDAARYADADSITAVIPQFPYARQERRKAREGITAKVIAKYLESAGVNRILTLDIHSGAIQGFFPKAKMINIHGSDRLISHIRTLGLKEQDTVVVAPDMGSTERARYYSNNLHYNIAVIDKARVYSKASTIGSMRLVGDVADKNVVIVDDMIATGGTLIHAIDTLKDHGAQDIYIAVSLPFLNGDAIDKFEKAYQEGKIKKVIGTDAVFRNQAFIDQHLWYEEVSVAPLFAEILYRINQRITLSNLLRKKI